MEIRNFDRIRVGSGWPTCVDIKPTDGHEHDGVCVVVHQKTSSDNYKGYVQFRKHNKNEEVAMITFINEFQSVPKVWEDSFILFDSRDINT